MSGPDGQDLESSHRHDVRVYFEDTDFTGRVYHGALIRFLERGRTELLRSSGLDHAALAARTPALFFTLRNFTVSFAAAAVIDDVLTVHSSPIGKPRAVFHIGQRITRGEELIANADVELCLIAENGRPMKPPPDVVAALSAPSP